MYCNDSRQRIVSELCSTVFTTLKKYVQLFYNTEVFCSIVFTAPRDFVQLCSQHREILFKCVHNTERFCLNVFTTPRDFVQLCSQHQNILFKCVQFCGCCWHTIRSNKNQQNFAHAENTFGQNNWYFLLNVFCYPWNFCKLLFASKTCQIWSSLRLL